LLVAKIKRDEVSALSFLLPVFEKTMYIFLGNSYEKNCFGFHLFSIRLDMSRAKKLLSIQD
jgi:hypothetical protein